MSRNAFLKGDPSCIVIGLQAARPGYLSSVACPVHPGMTQLSFVLSAAIKPSFMQRVRTAVAFSWAQMHHLQRKIAFFSFLGQFSIPWHQCNH